MPAYYLTEINERCRKNAAEFIAECDRVYQHRLEDAADRILENRKRSPIILLSGPSGSGKTTTAQKICEVMEKRGITTHSVSLDDYFKTVSPETTPRTESGDYDFESPLCLNMELLNEHFSILSAGGRVTMPRYDFVRQLSCMTPGNTLQLKDNELVIFEGIHALNDAITSVHPEAFKLYISARSNIFDDDGKKVFKGTWMRLMRRTVRDYKFRGTAAQSTLRQWGNIRRGEILYISPFKDKADFQFDSSFAYEVPILNNTATELFDNMPPETPRYQELLSIRPAFELFEDVSPELLAPDALLREFIGGGIYSY